MIPCVFDSSLTVTVYIAISEQVERHCPVRIISYVLRLCVQPRKLHPLNFSRNVHFYVPFHPVKPPRLLTREFPCRIFAKIPRKVMGVFCFPAFGINKKTGCRDGNRKCGTIAVHYASACRTYRNIRPVLTVRLIYNSVIRL